MKQLLGVDWGGVRIGLAIGSDKLRLARPLRTIKNDATTLVSLVEICRQEKIAGVVLGLPRNLEGRETAQSATVRRFGEELASKLECELVWQDETLSTKEAAALQKSYPKAAIDSLAATIILQDYLNTL